MTTLSLQDFFSSVNSHVISDQVTSYFHEKIILKNNFLLEEGRISDKFLLLASGYMRAHTYDLKGNSVTTGFYAPGNTVFDVTSYFNHTPSTENIQAISDCAGWSISYKDLRYLADNIPELREFIQRMLVRYFLALKSNSLSLINESAEQRYSRLLKTYPDICNNAQLKHIASYLGITDTSLSRIRKNSLNKVAVFA